MRRVVVMLTFALLCAAGTISGQQAGDQEKARWVVVPPEHVLLTVMSQPGCPLRFEQERYLANVAGGGGASYRLRNVGNKPIRAFTAADINTSANATLWAWDSQFTGKPLMPGELAPAPEDRRPEIIPLTDELRNRLKMRGPMIGVAVLMIVRVEFTDGSVFSDEPTYQALEKFFGSLDGKIGTRR